MNRQVLRSIILLNAMFMLGCGAAAPSTADAQPPNPYPTAEFLLAHINSLVTSDPFDQAGFDPLYYAESDLQRRLHHVVQSTRSFDEMLHLVWERFGAGLLPGTSFSPLAPLPPAEFIDRSPQRATARTFFPDETPFDLYLVQIGERWWVSGFTLERIFENSRVAEAIANIDGEALSRAARSFALRIDNDEFSTIEEVREVWIRHLRSQ